MRALDPDAVVVKGDLTEHGHRGGVRRVPRRVRDARVTAMHHVRGNHDAMVDPTMALEGAPYTVELGGVHAGRARHRRSPAPTAGSSAPTRCSGSTTSPARPTGPVLVFGHHHLLAARRTAPRGRPTSASSPTTARRSCASSPGARTSPGTSPATRTATGSGGSTAARNVPFVEVGCTKDYPGAWAEYRVLRGGLHAGGAAGRRRRDAFDWAERTRGHVTTGSTATTRSAPSSTAASQKCSERTK